MTAEEHHQQELEHQEWLEYEARLKADKENYERWSNKVIKSGLKVMNNTTNREVKTRWI